MTWRVPTVGLHVSGVGVGRAVKARRDGAEKARLAVVLCVIGVALNRRFRSTNLSRQETSSRAGLLARITCARLARSTTVRLRPSRFFSSAFLTTGTMRPQSRATAMPMLTCLR